MGMNITSIALTWLLAAQLAQADDPINVSKTGTVLSDEVLYSIGGGSAVSMGSAGQMDSIGVGFGWNNDMMCGNMNLSITLRTSSMVPHRVSRTSWARSSRTRPARSCRCRR